MLSALLMLVAAEAVAAQGGEEVEAAPVAAVVDLTLTNSDGGASVAPGGTVTYSLTYSDVGGKPATGTVLSETVPANTLFNPGASTAGWNCAGTACTLALGVIAAGGGGTAFFAITPLAMPAGVSQISNTASIADDGTHGADPTPGNNTASDTTPVNAAPDLSILKSDGGATVAPGATVVYTLSYANNGNRGASGVMLTETVPANTSFNAGASNGAWSCSPTLNAGSTCTLNLGILAAGGGSQTALFAVTVVSPVAAGVSQIANTASISDDGTNGTDPSPSNNTASDTTPVTGAPDLSLTKSDGGVSVAPGGTVAYTLSYSNSGNRGASGVALTETVPANTTFNAGASSGSWVCLPNSSAGSTCALTVGILAAGGGTQTATFAVTVVNPVIAGVSQIANTASIADDGTNGTDPTPGNNSGSDTTPLTGAPDLALTKSDGGVSVSPGGGISYTLTYANSGNRGASGVVITETVPANTVFNPGASDGNWVCLPGNNAGSTCTLSLGVLPAGGGNQTVTFAVTTTNPIPAGVIQIANTATISDNGTNGTDPTPGNNTGSDTTPILGAHSFNDYFTVQPCRLLDTRTAGAGGPVVSGALRVFTASGFCGIPADAIAVSVNLAVVSIPGDGYLTLYPGDGTAPLASTINFHLGGFTLSNNAIIQLAGNGTGTLGAKSLVGGGGGVHLVIDVVGYFK